MESQFGVSGATGKGTLSGSFSTQHFLSATIGSGAPASNGGHARQQRPGLGSRQNSAAQIDQLVSHDKIDSDTFGQSEIREGFFDALFLRRSQVDLDQLRKQAIETLPVEFEKGTSLSPQHLLPRAWNDLRSVIRQVTTTRAGIRLLKSFTAYFIAYVLCLVPVVRDWLGRYSYVMVLSAIINHPGRTFGSQIDGAILTILGTAAGLGWGTVGLLLSTSTMSASAGFGGILALFLALFMTVIAWLRSFFIRFYQGVLCAGIAITFTTLAETRSRSVEWSKISSYAIPWVLGQALALLVNIVVFPDAGARPLAVTLHEFFEISQDALVIPRPRSLRLRRQLAQSFVDLTQAYRDMRIDITITRFAPEDIKELRNVMQGVIRALLSMETETRLFDDGETPEPVTVVIDASASDPDVHTGPTAHLSIEEARSHVSHALAPPTRELLESTKEGLRRSHAALMDLAGYRKHLGPAMEVSSDIGSAQARLKSALSVFDSVESVLLTSGQLQSSPLRDPEILQLFIFARHVREAADLARPLVAKVNNMQTTSKRLRVHHPSYPFWKGIHWTNHQVRHDRGGITAGSYQSTFAEISSLLSKIKSREHRPGGRARDSSPVPYTDVEHSDPGMDGDKDGDGDLDPTSKRDAFGYKVWTVLRRLQGFESRFALKVCLTTALLSIPSYLSGQESWWDQYEVWWAVSMSWIMMHPRVGGNLEDLFVRAFSAILGAVWSGAAYAAGEGNPFVLAVFAAIFMLPMLYRFTQSSHPRSGLVACFSFTVISLGLRNHTSDASTNLLGVYKGLSFLVGTTVPIIVNWIFWPFIPRHELRSSLSSMLFFMSILYRNVVAKYVYFEEGQAPTSDDILRSEIIEGRLREGFVRVRQLLVMTRHELRLRGDFDPLPYSALADACERFFEYLIAVRQSAMYFNPGHIRDNTNAAEKLLGYRRDAAAAILGNLYILAGALRSRRKVPRYLPSAAAARKKLIQRSAEFERELESKGEQSRPEDMHSWQDIHSYSYRESLLGCVAQLEELEKYTKMICGERGFDDDFKDDELDEKGALLDRRNP